MQGRMPASPKPFKVGTTSMWFISITHAHTEFEAALLQDLQKVEAADPREAVAVNRYFLVAMNHIDVVPTLKGLGDAGMRPCIGFFQILQRAAREDDAPAKRVGWAIAFRDGDVVRRICALHQDRKVQSRRATTDDVDFH